MATYTPGQDDPGDMTASTFKKGLWAYSKSFYALVEAVVKATATAHETTMKAAWDEVKNNFPGCIELENLFELDLDQEIEQEIMEVNLQELYPIVRDDGDEPELDSGEFEQETMSDLQELLWAKNALGRFKRTGTRPKKTEFPNDGCVAYFELATKHPVELFRLIKDALKTAKGGEESQDDMLEDRSIGKLEELLTEEVSTLPQDP